MKSLTENDPVQFLGFDSRILAGRLLQVFPGATYTNKVFAEIELEDGSDHVIIDVIRILYPAGRRPRIGSPMSNQLLLWEQNRSDVMQGLRRVSDVSQTMIVVADLRDKVGGKLVRVLARTTQGDLDRHIQDAAQKGEVPSTLIFVPVKVISDSLAAQYPEHSAKIAKPLPPGYVWITIIAENGALVFQAPIETV